MEGKDQNLQKSVKERYTRAATQPEERLCCPTGYTPEDLEGLPEEVTKISYGCGNPTALGMIQPGEAVLDIGSGGGIDCFIASKRTGPTGRVIGVDMTEKMLRTARKNSVGVAKRLGYANVEFRKGDADALPVKDASVDLVISNCVLNLMKDKEDAFQEIYRVLREGGRLCVSDIVSDREVPSQMQRDPDLWSGCISGSLTQKKFLKAIEKAGFFGLSIEKVSLWKKIEGISFSSIALKAYK